MLNELKTCRQFVAVAVAVVHAHSCGRSYWLFAQHQFLIESTIKMKTKNNIIMSTCQRVCMRMKAHRRAKTRS